MLWDQLNGPRCVHVCDCVYVGGSSSQVVGVPGSISSHSYCFLDQETLLTLLQSTQLYYWVPGNAGKADANCPCLP